MRRQSLSVLAAVAIVAAACTSSSSTASPGASASPALSAAPSEAASASAATSGAPSASSAASAGASGSADYSSITGSATLSGWQSSPAEGAALTATLKAFASAYPNIKLDYAPVSGDYPTVMATNFASGDVPDIFYVNADQAATWISQGFLAPLDDDISKYGFDTSQFYDGYASIFKGSDGKTYGFPKDGNTIAMAYDSSVVTTPPATLADLLTAARRSRARAASRRPSAPTRGSTAASPSSTPRAARSCRRTTSRPPSTPTRARRPCSGTSTSSGTASP
jgi:multiple sugar transport system substrate-binding protein